METSFEPTMSPAQREWYVAAVNRRAGFDVPAAVKWGLDNGTLVAGKPYEPVKRSKARKVAVNREGYVRGSTAAALYSGIPASEIIEATKLGALAHEPEGKVFWYAKSALDAYAAGRKVTL